MTCEGETSCVRVPAVPNAASSAPAGVRRARPIRCVAGPVALLTVATTSAVPFGVDAQAAGVDLVDGRGRAVEVGGRVAGGRRRRGPARRRRSGARRPAGGAAWSPGCRRGRCGPRRRARGRRTSCAAPPRRKRDLAVGAEARVAHAGGGQPHEQAVIGAAAGGGGGDEDVPVGGDGEAAELGLRAGRRDQLAAGRERRVEVAVGGQAGDEQRRRRVDRERRPAEQDLAVRAARSAPRG